MANICRFLWLGVETVGVFKPCYSFETSIKSSPQILPQITIEFEGEPKLSPQLSPPFPTPRKSSKRKSNYFVYIFVSINYSYGSHVQVSFSAGISLAKCSKNVNDDKISLQKKTIFTERKNTQ
jgi:hypothetical protein